MLDGERWHKPEDLHILLFYIFSSDSLHKLLNDPTVEMTKYRVRLSFLSVVVLHEDPVSTPGDALDPTITSWQKLHVSTDRYFGSLASLSLGGTDAHDLMNIRQHLTQSCPYDHLRYGGMGGSFGLRVEMW